MGLLEDIEAAHVNNGPSCTVALLLDSLPKEERGALESAFANPAFQATRISRVLSEHGHTVGASTIQRHRRKGCRCP